jgi:probable addiction module antidote protein
MKKAKRKTTSPRSATAIDAYIGAQIRKRSLALKLGQADLAKALGVTKQQFQKYEAGQNRVSAARLFGICRVLKASLSSMFKPDEARRADEAEYRDNTQAIAQYLNDACSTRNPAVIAKAIGDMIRAQGVSEFSEKARMRREPLYRSFGGKSTLPSLQSYKRCSRSTYS